MSFFRRRSSTALAVESPFSVGERQHVEALWRLTALPREEFAVTYEAMLARAWRWISSGVDDEWAALRREGLANMIAALRARQAWILPRFAPAEDAARLTEVMSFALAAVVLAERMGLVIGRAAAAGWCPWTEDLPSSAVLQKIEVPRSYGALLVPRLLGIEGRSWVSQEPIVLREIAAYFGQDGELRKIAADAAARIGAVIGADQDLVAAGDEPHVGAEARNRRQGERPETVEKEPATRRVRAGKCLAPETREVVPVGRATGCSASADTAGGSALEKAEAAGEEALDAGEAAATNGRGGDREGPPVIGTEGAGWRWINWVRRGYYDGSIEANVDGGWLYSAEGEAYVVMPECFEAFATLEELEWKKVKNQVTRLKRHRLRSSPSGAASTFRGELADGRRVEGMLFPGELVWDDGGPAAAEVVLRQRRRRT